MRSSTLRTIGFGIIATACLICAGATPSSQVPGMAAEPSLADLGWMEGKWVREEKGQYLEETWSAPVNNSLAGMFRWNRDGKPWMCELMTISLDGDKRVFRLRHFDATLKPWEKEAALLYPLAKMSDNQVVFEDANAPAEHPRRFIYTRAGDQLTVRLENADGTGDDFVFARVGNAGDNAAAKPAIAKGSTGGANPIGFTGGLLIRFTVMDRAKSRDWYHDMLGFDVVLEQEDLNWTEMKNADAQLMIGLSENKAVSVCTGTVPVIGVRDLDAARRQLEDRGVKFTSDAIINDSMVKFATLLDPDGHQIMLYQTVGD